MPRLSSTLALCAALAVSPLAAAVESLQQMDTEVRELGEPVPSQTADERAAHSAAGESGADAPSVSGIATAGMEAGEPAAPASSQTRASSPAPLQRPGSRWNAFLPGMVR